MTGEPEREGTAAVGTAAASDRRDGEIREALEQDAEQATSAIDNERRDARHTQNRTDIQRRGAREVQDQVDVRADTQRRDAREVQDQVDVEADTQRRDAREVQDQVNVEADTQRRDAREVQDQVDVQADTQRRDAREAQDQINVRADTQRRDAREAQDQIDVRADTQRRGAREAQDQIETAQDSERRDAQESFDARRDDERRDALEQNVADQQRADELEQANQNLEAFAYTVSHDLRAPLRAMDSYSAILLEEHGPALGAEGRVYAERIQAASQRMGELIAALLRLARLARAEVCLQPVDLGAEAAAVAAELQASEPRRRVRFTIQQPAWVLADRQLIRTVLQNLLGNAWKFTVNEDDAQIELRTMPEGTRTRCYIRDNGAGFDPAQAGKLFTAFQRLHSASEFPGTGIGLASVRQIVERHGGRVRATGATGEGATFSFSLAAASPQPETQTPPAAQPPRPEATLEGRHVRAGYPAVDEERRGGDERGVVAGQERDRGGDLLGLGEPAHRHVHEPALGPLRVGREKLAQQRRVHRPRAQRVDPDPLARELHAELTGHGQHAALGRGVGDLRRGRAHHGDERGGVHDGPAPLRAHVADRFLTAQVHRGQVDLLHPAPGVKPGSKNRIVVRR
jgi:signal transduction histidine kinase